MQAVVSTRQLDASLITKITKETANHERYSTWKLRDGVAEFACVFPAALPLGGKKPDIV